MHYSVRIVGRDDEQMKEDEGHLVCSTREDYEELLHRLNAVLLAFAEEKYPHLLLYRQKNQTTQ